MKVLIMTNPEYEYFVRDTIKPYATDEHLFLVCPLYRKFEGWEEINGIGYDIGISFMYQYKVPAKEVNTHTWFNFHPAPLPEYKGRNLCYHAIINGAEEFGATIHYMDENFDTGDIIDVQRFVILPHYTAQDVSEIAIEMSKAQFELFFLDIISGKQFERYPNVGGTYYSKTEIDDYIGLTDYQDRKLRAITYKEFYPKIDVGGRIYKVIPE